MKIHTVIHQFKTGEGVDLVRLDDAVKDAVSSSGIRNGMMVISSRHTTTALAINEYEERLLTDVRNYFEKLAPPGDRYLHNDIHLRDCPEDEPENAHSHLLAMLLSSSEVVPVVAGELQLGQWQSVILFELDGPRQRTVNIQVMGE